MSKSQKLLIELRKKPPPTDFRWIDLVTVMENARFTVFCKGGGSHHIFEHVCGFRVVIAKTHPGGILKKYQIDAALDALRHACKNKEKE